ncbi:hypothetical protein MMC10_006778 [Thelotrema lepadinum]|nr:hypothetical protein [Thelotrema lepadinum]
MLLYCILWLSLLYVLGVDSSSSRSVSISDATSINASAPIPESFVSFSIELAFFPDYAGNVSSPNTFSYNLLNNLGNLTGSKPAIRVGGNTQDYALYDPSLKVATNGTYTSSSSDYPTILSIGESFFESYSTWPDVQFTHGFNLANNGTAGHDTLVATAPLACNALSGGKLLAFELGNEPDLYKASATWNEQSYVTDWLNKTRIIKTLISSNCSAAYRYIAPSFAGTHNNLDMVKTWHAGLDTDKDIIQISSHNYISGATSPGVTLQGTLMNHTSTVSSISSQLTEMSSLSNYSLPFILGETNSLYNEGAPGLSNAFGAALWGLDFNLWCASQGIRRVHMHQGTNYRYAAWQPVATSKTTIGTKAPYYGSIAVAAMLGNLVVHNTSIANIALPSEREAAYLAYEDGKLARLLVVNMQAYNYTLSGTGTGPLNPAARGNVTYTFNLAGLESQSARVQRLSANGSDAVTGISWDGYSYNYELDAGRPVVLGNVTTGEMVTVAGNGSVSVVVPWSSAAVLTFLEC